MVKCVKCGLEQSDEANFCMKCGARIVRKPICPKCKKELPEGSDFCMFCGASLKQEKTDDEILITGDESSYIGDTQPAVDVSFQSSDDIDEMPIQDDAYAEVLRTYLKAAILDELSERMTGYRINDTSIPKMICATEYKRIIKEKWGHYNKFEEECLDQKYKNLGYSYDVDHGAIKGCFKNFYDMSTQKNPGFRLHYNDKNAIEFIMKQHIVEASYIDLISKSLLSEYENNGTKELIPGKANDYINNAEIISFLADALKCDDSFIPTIGNIKQIDNYKTPNSYVWMDDHNIWENQIIKACYIKDEYIYYFEKEGVHVSSEYGFNICRFNMRTRTKEVLQPALINVQYGMGCIDSGERFPLFSIFEDRIYYPSSGRVFVMNLDGSNVAPVYGFENKWRINGDIQGVWAIHDGILICANGGLYRLLYGVDPKPVKILTDIRDLMDFSDKVIVTKSGKIIDIRSKEKKSINKVYPGLGKNSPLLVDSNNEIAYYYKKSDVCGFADKIIGTDKNGDIVNVWNFPLLSDNQKKLDGYDSLVFNGGRMMGKFIARALDKGCWRDSGEKQPGCAAYVAEYDHLGFENVLYQMDKISFDTEYCFGAHHYISGGMNIVLMGVDKQKYEGSYWITAITHHGEAIPFDMFR